MPESVRDRATRGHEYVFMLSKGPRYHWDQEAVKEPIAESSIRKNPKRNEVHIGNGAYSAVGGHKGGVGVSTAVFNPSGRNIRDVLTIATEPCREANFAVMPQRLVEPC